MICKKYKYAFYQYRFTNSDIVAWVIVEAHELHRSVTNGHVYRREFALWGNVLKNYTGQHVDRSGLVKFHHTEEEPIYMYKTLKDLYEHHLGDLL